MPQHPIGLSISRALYKMTEKRQISKGYIIRNFTTFRNETLEYY